MRKVMKYILIIVLLIFVIYGYGQTIEEYSFSLEEAKQFALENNKMIKNAQYDVNASEKKTWQAVSAGLPQAEASMDYTNYFNYELEFQFGASEDFAFTQEQLNEATAQTLNAFPGIPGAGISGVTPQDLYNHSAGTYYDNQLQQMMPATTILMSDQMSAKLQVSQLIFSGQYIVGIQTAKLAERLSVQSLDKTRNDVKEIVSLAYYLVLLTEESKKIVDENYINLKKTIEKTKALLKVGMAEELDVKQIQISLIMLENAKKSLDRNIEVNYNTLRFQLGLNPDSKIILTSNLEEIINGIDLENALLIAFNYENNINYQLVNTQEQLSEKMVNMEKASYLPTLAGFYSHNEKIITTDFDMNPKNLVGLNLSWPLFTSGSRNAKVQEAKIGLEKTKTSKEMLLNQLKLQEKEYRYNLKNAIENYKVQKESMQIAQELYKNYERKYNQGIISSLDLTQASNNYLDSQNNYISSVFDVLQTKLALDKLVNNL